MMSYVTVFCAGILFMPADVSAIPIPEQRPQSLEKQEIVDGTLLRATQELKILNRKRVVLQTKIQKLELNDKKISSNVSETAPQNYTEDLRNLQIAFDKVFVTLDYAHYSADLGEPVLFTSPEQVIADMRSEWITEYIVKNKFDNLQRGKQQLQKLQKQELELTIQKEKTLQQQKKTLDVELAKLDLDITNKQENILKLQRNLLMKRKAKIRKTKVLAQALPYKKPISKKVKKNKSTFRSLVFPVHGKVVMGFGEKDALGVKSRGLVLQADISKDVVSPRDGVVRFAGPFGKFKQLLIVEHQGGYHSLITGFDIINARVGEKLSAGDSIGHLAATQAYYELRYNGVPIDPEKAINSL